MIRPSPPMQISVTRGGHEESLHLVDLVACDADGQIICSHGEPERLVFPRSAIKPLQAIALIETMMAQGRINEVDAADISLFCASHNGEPMHVARVRDLLDRFGLREDALCCTGHWSNNQQALIEQVNAGKPLGRAHNNCSGKHTGMLLLSQLLGLPEEGYGAASHPLQARIINVMNELTGADLLTYPHGIDGCAAPALSGPMHHWARGFATFADSRNLPEHRQKAIRLITESIAAEPLYIAGHGRACSAINAAFGQDITVKVGAEGVYSAAIHCKGVGLMLKARDGQMRAAEVALGAAIEALGIPLPETCSRFFRPVVTNWGGDSVGEITWRV